MKRQILMVDDDKLVMSTYEAYLHDLQMEVVRFHGDDCVDRALEYLKTKADDVAVIVLDMMMPPGESFKNVNTNGGLRTGLFFLRLAQARYRKIPTVILTNVSNEETLGEIGRVSQTTIVLQKPYCPPDDLAERIQNLLKGGM